MKNTASNPRGWPPGGYLGYFTHPFSRRIRGLWSSMRSLKGIGRCHDKAHTKRSRINGGKVLTHSRTLILHTRTHRQTHAPLSYSRFSSFIRTLWGEVFRLIKNSPNPSKKSDCESAKSLNIYNLIFVRDETTGRVLDKMLSLYSRSKMVFWVVPGAGSAVSWIGKKSMGREGGGRRQRKGRNFLSNASGS